MIAAPLPHVFRIVGGEFFAVGNCFSSATGQRMIHSEVLRV